MSIQWFPGHMLTARKHVVEAMSRTDVVIEVLDARAPHASTNPTFEAMRVALGRPALKLLNKTDLADPARTQRWLAHLGSLPGVKAVAISGRNAGEAGKLPAHCKALAPTRGTPLKPLRMMILGVPNVGKSTLLNALSKRKLAKVGDEPAITKQHQRTQLAPGLLLVDTPGLLWGKIPERDALVLAATNAIGRNAYDDGEVAAALAALVQAQYPGCLAARYGEAAPDTHGHGLVAWIARRRGLVKPGGDPDVARASGLFIGDFRSGALGRLTLETPEEVASRGAEVKLVEVPIEE